MSYDTYNEVETAVRNRYAFRGNSCYSMRTDKGYVVYSYNTQIYNDKDGLDISFYSTTTSRIQGLIADYLLGVDLKELRTYPQDYKEKIWDK